MVSHHPGASGEGAQRTGGLLFLAWGAIAGRSSEIAEALGGTATCFYPPAEGRRRPAGVRYLLAGARTLWLLARRRPEVVVATNPPVFPGLLAFAWGRLTGAAVALDSHPGAFGAKDDRFSERLLPLHRWLARRVTLSLVAAPSWQEQVESWGAPAMVVHEAPGPWRPTPPPRHHPLKVLYVGTFANDEPLEALIEAFGRVPQCEVFFTGRLDDCPAHIRRDAPANVRFVGFLDAPDYQHLMEECDVVVTLTTEPNSVMRAAYEAIYAGRPVIVSDWPLCRELFPYAQFTSHDADGLTEALTDTLADFPALVERTEVARATQLARWDEQCEELERRLLKGATAKRR